MKLDIIDLGLTHYAETWEYQKKLVHKRQQKEIPDTLILTEHYPVITLGRRSHTKNKNHSQQRDTGIMDDLRTDKALLQQKGIEIIEIERGGKATFHGPGQIVGYPIIALREKGMGVKEYVEHIETFFIRLLQNEFKLPASTNPANRGVWIRQNKIIAIGIALDHWVTYHGFAFNVNTDLRFYDFIVPCGLNTKGVTSLEKTLGEKADITTMKDLIVSYFCEVLHYEYPKDNQRKTGMAT